MKPDVEPRGDELYFLWRDQGIGLLLDRFRETDSGLVKAFIDIESMAAGADRHVWWGQVTLTANTDRRTVVTKIQKAAPLDADEWEYQIDRCFQYAAQWHMRVPEPERLREVPLEEDTTYLFDPLAPLGQVTELLADQGVSKSYLMLYLLVATSAGVETVFGPPAVTGPTILYDWETDGRSQRRRLEWVCRGLGMAEPPADFYYLCMQERGRLMDRQRDMRAQIAKLGAVAVGIDSLTFATGANLNDTENSGPTMNAIGSLGEGVSKLVAAHHGKAGRDEKNGRPSVIGSGLFEFKARSIWLLQREQEGQQSFEVGLRYVKLSDGPKQRPLAYRISFDNAAGVVRFTSTRVGEMSELGERSYSAADRIRALLRSRRDAKGDTAEMAELLNLSAEVVRVTLNRMPDAVRLVAGVRGQPSVWGLGNGIAEQAVTPTDSGPAPTRRDAVSVIRNPLYIAKDVTDTASGAFRPPPMPERATESTETLRHRPDQEENVEDLPF